MAGYSEFVWTLPCYILANNCTINSETGEVVFDEHIRFITPERDPGGEKTVAIFTDSDLATQYRDDSPERGNVDLLAFNNLRQLKSFLRAIRPYYRYLAVDPNRKTKISRLVSIEEMLQELDQIEGQGGSQ